MGLSLQVPSGISYSVLVSTAGKSRPLRITRSRRLQLVITNRAPRAHAETYASIQNCWCHPRLGCIAPTAKHGVHAMSTFGPVHVTTRDTQPVSWCTRIRCGCPLTLTPIIRRFWPLRVSSRLT